MEMDDHGNFSTIDDKFLSEEWLGGWEWFSSFEAYHGISGGKFSAWRTTTKWPRKRWDETARDFSCKLAYRWDKYYYRANRRGNQAKETLNKMRHYYGFKPL